MLILTEAPRAAFEIATLPLVWKIIRRLNKKVENKTIVTVPGLMGADGSTAIIRKYLRSLGYTCYGWDQGRNLGLHVNVEEKFEEYLEELVEVHQRPISLIGHSLGGLYSREMAKRRPDLINNVITLGSPFNHPDFYAHAAIRVLYEILNGEASVSDYELIQQLKIPPTCPTHCLYSKKDGVVHWNSCLQENPPPHVENVEVLGSHMGMGHNALILYMIGERLQKT